MIKGKLFVFLLMILSYSMVAQNSTRYGLKLGPLVGFQRWNYFQHDPLFKYHGNFWMESYQDDESYSFITELGYHLRGSATRYLTPLQFGNKLYTIPTDEFIFRNASLLLGIKKKFPKEKVSTYYSFGLRGEYTMSTNLKVYDEINKFFPVYPFDGGVKKFMVGVSFSGGIELPFGDYTGGILEFTIAPDITRQYYQPQLNNIINIYAPSTTTSIGEKSIKNLSLELSLGIYFTRKVTYVD